MILLGVSWMVTLNLWCMKSQRYDRECCYSSKVSTVCVDCRNSDIPPVHVADTGDNNRVELAWVKRV